MITAQPGREPGRQPGRRRVGGPPGGGAADAPVVPRMMVGVELRKLREASEITRAAAGEAIRASDTKISRIERGRVSFKERDVTDLLTLYGVTDEQQRATILERARKANAPGWWTQYRDVLPGWYERYLELEQAAVIIRTYEVQFLPGLLQTEDYAYEVSRLGDPDAPSEQIERRVSLRMARQQLLTQPQAPKLWVIIDETALRRPPDDPQVMHKQLRRLIELIELPNVTVQVARFHLGGHAAAGCGFTLLRFDEPDLPEVVYLEQLTSALYLDKQHDVVRYAMAMESLSRQAKPSTDTIRILKRIIEDT